MRRFDISENELRTRYISTLSDKGSFFAQQEVPVFCRSVDLVVHDHNTEILTAIEFKLHDWKRAIDQVQSIRFCFDYSCICMPKPITDHTLKILIQACKERDIGLILYDIKENRFETVNTTPQRQQVWSIQKKKIVNYLEEKYNESTIEAVEI